MSIDINIEEDLFVQETIISLYNLGEKIEKKINFYEDIFLKHINNSSHESVFIGFKEIGASTLGVLYYNLHYLEKKELYHASLLKLDSQLRAKNISKKDKYKIEKKHDKIEECLLDIQDKISYSIKILNSCIKDFAHIFDQKNEYYLLDSEKILKFSKIYKKTFLSLLADDALLYKKFGFGLSTSLSSNYYSKTMWTYESKDRSSGLNLLDCFDALSWFGNEAAYLSKINKELCYFYLLPAVLSGAIPSKIRNQLDLMFKSIVKILSSHNKDSFVLDLQDYDANEDFVVDFIRELFSNDFAPKGHKSNKYNSFDDFTLTYCRDKLTYCNISEDINLIDLWHKVLHDENMYELQSSDIYIGIKNIITKFKTFI